MRINDTNRCGKATSIQALLAGVLGTSLQWYDFAIFGYFATIIANTFFPEADHIANLMKTFAIFAVGYLLAPIGSVIFGYISDIYGRKRALSISILAMAIPTALISITPGYNTIGILAPILITILRMTQGLVASTEFTNSAIFLVEHAPAKSKALYGCLTSSAYSLGMVFAGIIASFLTSNFMPHWGWRIGFAISILGGLIVFFLRKHVEESPEFIFRETSPSYLELFKETLKTTSLSFFSVIGIAWFVGIITFGTFVFLPNYLHAYHGIPLSKAILFTTIGLIIDASLEPLVASYSDRKGFKKVMSIGMAGFIVLSLPLFYLLQSDNPLWIFVSVVSLSSLIAISYAPLNAYMVSLFPPHLRATGFGVAFNLGITLFGGTAPFVLSWLAKTHGSLSPAIYYITGSIIALSSVGVSEKN